MSKSVSVPEKTLEHWSSQYITYRYLSKAALWWPATGEDIDVRWLPARPGKVVQLELKTTTVVRPGVHDVMVDLGQLWEYRQRRPGRQPFYAFPKPDSHWPGNLAVAAIAEGHAVTELGFARSGPGWWFADWMVVLTAAQVAEVLRRELAAHGSKERGKRARLVRFDRSLPKPEWGPRAAPSLVEWRDFWTALEHCGRRGWPQLIRLPARVLRARSPYSSPLIERMLREATDIASQEGDADEPLVTLEPDADGIYQVTQARGDAAESDENGIEEEDRNYEASDHRQVVFLDAQALLRARWTPSGQVPIK